MKKCKQCGRMLFRSMFYKNTTTKDGLLSFCKQCTVKRYSKGVNERAARDRAVLQQYKVDHGCADCGYNANAVALDFDHRPGEVKLYKMASAMGLSPTTLAAEIAKCDVVCANCHRIRTDERRKQAKAERLA